MTLALLLKLTLGFICFMAFLVVAACVALWWTFRKPKNEDYE